MTDNVVEVDFGRSQQDEFESDMEDAINGVLDVLHDHMDEDVANSVALALAKCLEYVASKIVPQEPEETPPKTG